MADSRKIALEALLRVEQDGAFSNLVLGKLLEKSEASKEDKALASALFYGVLDRKITLDFYINKLSRIKAKKLDPITRQVIRIGIYQLYYMQRIPNSAAVNESVKLIKQSAESRNSGYVNAVLRSAVINKPELPMGRDLFSLSVRYSCPAWILTELTSDYGSEKAEEILKSFLIPSKVTLRVNTLKTTSDELFDKFCKLGIQLVSNGNKNSFEVKGGIDFNNNQYYKDGLFHIQDISSQNCALALSAAPYERILDVCSAPGGKSFTVAQQMKNRGEVVSCDLYENRVSLIKSGADRLGLDCIKPTVNDATVFNSSLGLFDAVLCDVPCSGFGVIRRKPEIKYKPAEDFDQLAQIQYKILKTSSAYVKDGGRLLYSTCTLRKAENERIVEQFLAENTAFKCEYMHTDLPGENNDGFFRTLLIKI